MRNKPTVFIICGVHNGLDYTKNFLSSVAKQSHQNIITIIIDDGSTDGTEEFIRQNYPKLILIKGDGNLWWTGALYEGVKKALTRAGGDDFILTVNNDCILSENLVSNLVTTSKVYQRAIVGSLIIDKNNKTQIADAGVRIDWLKGKYISLPPKKTADLPKDKTIQENIDTLSTKGTLYPIEVFRKIGNFDNKHLPHYISDYEFACRAKRNGFRLLLSFNARVYNDITRTGFGEKLPKKITLKEFWELLFSRKSRLNIVDQFWFMTLCCPKKYLLVNYFAIVLKIIFLLSYVPPFYLVRRLMKKC